MSLFILVYDRTQQKLLELREFADTDRVRAEAFRLERQRRSLSGNLDQEIVLFQAESEDVLRRTHGSYFLSNRELLDRAREAAGAS